MQHTRDDVHDVHPLTNLNRAESRTERVRLPLPCVAHEHKAHATAVNPKCLATQNKSRRFGGGGIDTFKIPVHGGKILWSHSEGSSIWSLNIEPEVLWCSTAVSRTTNPTDPEHHDKEKLIKPASTYL